MHIALATYDAPNPGILGDQPLIDALRERGASAEFAAWDKPGLDWSQYDAVLLRSTWNYVFKPEQFRAWLAEVDAQTRLFNPAAVVLHNMDKRYLRGLERRGVPLCPTVWVEPGERPDLAALLAQRSWSRAFIKPCIGAGASGTLPFDASGVAQAQAHLAEVLQGSAVMIQPYLPSVESIGELSLLMFDGQLSHALIKRPQPGDYRVQENFGAVDEAVQPDAEALALAQTVMACFDESPLYARVDLLRDLTGRWVLNELEMIEPYLFFRHGPQAPAMLAEALLLRL